MGMPRKLVDYWDMRIREDIGLLGPIHSRWRTGEAMVRNTGEGRRNGNLAADFIRVMHGRLLNTDVGIEITSDDALMSEFAEKATIAARSVARIIGLRETLQKAVGDATWAFGVIEHGHPLDPFSHDVIRSVRSPNTQPPTVDSDMIDHWEEVDDVERFGVDVNEIQAGDVGDAVTENTPKPIFSSGFGYPWVAHVDPRLIVMPVDVVEPRLSPYIGRIRFITRAELKIVQKVDFGEGLKNSVAYDQLFKSTEKDGDLRHYPEMLAIVELYIKRDRNNPDYNGYFISFVLGHPDKIITEKKMRFGGMVPFSFIKLNPLKGMYDTTLVEELQQITDDYARGVAAIGNDIKRMYNRPVMLARGHGIDEKKKGNVVNPDFKGLIEVSNPESIKELFADRQVDDAMIRLMMFLKSVAQSRSGTSDIDRGVAIKDITARQTQALLDATGINIEGMARAVSLGAKECVIKMMHLVGLMSTAIRSRRFNYGNRFASFDRGYHDFVTSLVYEVEIKDSLEEIGAEQLAIFVQFFRTILTNPNIAPYYDMEYLARESLKRFGIPLRGLASMAPNREPQGIANDLQAQAQLQAAQSNNGGAPGEGMLSRDMVEGQHPERMALEQGQGGAANLIRGAKMTGMQR